MKLKIVVILAVMALGSAISTPLHAKIKTVEKGDKLNFDPSRFPPDMKSAFEIMRVKCTQCHTQERTVIAITTGVAPVSNLPFGVSGAKAYGNKMLRKTKSNMSKEEVGQVVSLMLYLIDEAAKP